MAGQITLFPRSLFEEGTVTVTGDADTGYPEARLYNRAIGFYWKVTATQATTFHVDMAAAVAADFLAIARHNFNGEDIAVQHSENDVDWSDAVTGWTQGDNNAIHKALTEATKRYWRITVTSMDNPQAVEIFLSKGYTFDIQARSPVWEPQENVIWKPTVGGQERSVKRGDVRRIRQYELFLESADLANFRTAVGYLDEYSVPFYIQDDEDNYFPCRFLEPPRERHDHTGATDGTHITVKVIEMI